MYFFDAEKQSESHAAAEAAAAAAPAAAAAAAAEAQHAHGPVVFDPTAFPFDARHYRIHFKNGISGEYDGAILAHTFPFDVREVERVEPVEEVGA